MALKDDLLKKGYLPENLPPTFVTQAIGANIAGRNGWLTDGKNPVRSSPFNASKRGMTRREFSFVHPSTAHDLALHCGPRGGADEPFRAVGFQPFETRLRPGSRQSRQDRVPFGTGERPAFAIGPVSLRCPDGHLAVLSFDLHHSIPWAVHGRHAAKADRNPASANCYANRLDLIVRAGQDGQTVRSPSDPTPPDMSLR